jgi:hypothetical protein
MGWVSNQYDRYSRGLTLKRAVFYLSVYILVCFWGLVQILDLPQAVVHVDLKWGISYSVLGLLGVLHSLETLRAVVRRRRRSNPRTDE